MPFFCELSATDIEEVLDGRKSKRTKQVISGGRNAFLHFLTTIGQTLDNVTETTVDKIMQRFLLSVRKQNGEHYKMKSFECLQYGVKSFLKSEKFIDLADTKKYPMTDEACKAARVEIKRAGKGMVEHKNPLNATDFAKLKTYCDQQANISPKGLQRKVFVDVMLHFCRRGRENLREIGKSWFQFHQDEAGNEYVTMSDELDKNHRATTSRASQGRMYATGEANCPVAALKKYIICLHPDTEVFFQYPKAVFLSDAPSYERRPHGHNTLHGMVRQLSQDAQLSRAYTNHCLRATVVTNLDQAGVEGRHIQGVSGHKSLSSLQHYAENLPPVLLQKMSRVINGAPAVDAGASGDQVTAGEPSGQNTFNQCQVVIHYNHA